MSILIDSFINELKLNGFREGTIKGIKKVLVRLDKYKSLENCTENDIKAFLSSGEKSKNTLAIYKSYIRKFFTWYKKPELVGWVKVRIVKKKLDENALLTNEEIRKMLEFANHPRDKSLIALLTETGARISELLSLNISDLREVDYGMVVRIPDQDGNKTGSRCIPIIDSVQYVKMWLNQYPKPCSDDNPIFISFDRASQHERLTYDGAYKRVRKIAHGAGIKKDVHPHLFRHTQLTEMVRQGYNESIIRKKAGWVGDSKMIDIYLHATDKDLEKATLTKHGLWHTQQTAPQIQLTKECPQCHKQMPIEAQFCESCSKHQDLGPVVKRLLEENQQILARVQGIQDEKKEFVEDKVQRALLKMMENQEVRAMLKEIIDKPE